MSNLTIIANIVVVREEYLETVKKELLKLIPITREEKGIKQ